MQSDAPRLTTPEALFGSIQYLTRYAQDCKSTSSHVHCRQSVGHMELVTTSAIAEIEPIKSIGQPAIDRPRLPPVTGFFYQTVGRQTVQSERTIVIIVARCSLRLLAGTVLNNTLSSIIYGDNPDIIMDFSVKS